jgi:hypothetical protein
MYLELEVHLHEPVDEDAPHPVVDVRLRDRLCQPESCGNALLAKVDILTCVDM